MAGLIFFWNQPGGATPPPTSTTDTHDGGYSREEYDALRRRIREADKARKLSRKAREKARQKLAEELDRSYRRVVLNEPEIAQEVIAAIEPQAVIIEEAAPQIDWRKLTDILDTAGTVLAILERQRRVDAWMAADEDDVEILLLS